MIRKLITWVNKPYNQKINSLTYRFRFFKKIRFYLGFTNYKYSYTAYHPDSHVKFDNHKEYQSIFKKFIHLNKLNNSGDIPRLWSFILNIKQTMLENIEGDFAEVGVYKGNTSAILAHYAMEQGRKLYLFDTFDGFDSKDLIGIDDDKKVEFTDTSIEIVEDVIGQNKTSCTFVKGSFPGSIESIHRLQKFAVVSLDCDLYKPTIAGLEFFYPLMPMGGIFLLHDYSSDHWSGSKQAIDEFCKGVGEYLILMPDKSGSAFFRKSSSI
jgi:hypothetical protein